MPKWTVPPMWAEHTVVVLATGPSLTPQQCLLVRAARALNPKRTAALAVSDAFRLAPWADLLYSADAQWWHHHAQDALSFEGLKVSVCPSLAYRHVNVLKQGQPEGFDPSPDTLATGGNSGYQAVHLAIHAKAARILLVGFDMSAKNGAHFFGNHPKPLHDSAPSSYDLWSARFRALAGRGASIINCTPGSRIECFPRMDLEEALES